MTNLTQYEKGCSPSAIQRKYGLTYEQGYEFAERLKKTQELELENTKLKDLLKDWLLFAEEENPEDFTVMSERMQELAQQTNGLLGEE